MSTSRREFLKTSAYLTGTALGASAFGPMAPRMVYAAEKGKLPEKLEDVGLPMPLDAPVMSVTFIKIPLLRRRPVVTKECPRRAR